MEIALAVAIKKKRRNVKYKPLKQNIWKTIKSSIGTLEKSIGYFEVRKKMYEQISIVSLVNGGEDTYRLIDVDLRSEKSIFCCS